MLLWVPPLQPLPRGDTTLESAPLNPLHHIQGHPGGPHRLRGPRPRAQGSPPAPCLSRYSRHPHQGPAGAPPLDLSPASIIRRPLFHCKPIPRILIVVRDLHDEIYYDLFSFFVNSELRDSMLLVQRYSLEPFMTPRLFLYPRVVIEFYNTMTSRRESNPTTLHFSIDGRPGILRASDIAATFNLPMVLANSTANRQWPHPLPKEMVRLLSEDTTVGSVLFRRQLLPRMLLIDHIPLSNLFPLQHTVQRRGAILEALYRISEGYWFSQAELIMTSLFHFKDKVHRKSLPRAESMPLLFPRLLCQVLEHIGFPDEPRLESRRDCEASLTVDWW